MNWTGVIFAQVKVGREGWLGTDIIWFRLLGLR